MLKNIFFSLLFIFFADYANAQTNIAEARNEPIGTQVTISGIISHGNVFAPSKRHIQDETAGLVLYSSAVSSLNRGDSVTVTGTLKDYNGLLELDPVSNVTVHASGKTIEPTLIPAAQIGEAYEGQLIQLENVLFDNAGATFGSGANNYSFTADGIRGEIRTENWDLEGEIIPAGQVTLTGLLSQYSPSGAATGYQILPRDYQDFEITSAIYLTSPVEQLNLTTDGFSVSWETNMAGSTEMFYGTHPDTLDQYASSVTATTNHNLEINNVERGQLYFVKPFSVLGEDTAKIPLEVFSTISNSSGNVHVYFNDEVDHSVAKGALAINVGDGLDDTLINYINRAKYSIDFTMYSFNNQGISNISEALNNAHNRGVQVRVVYDNEASNQGIEALDPGIGAIADPVEGFPNYGIMHNKFIIFDAHSPDPLDPYVWTGGTNMTDGQVNTDLNDVIIVQDQSLARGYTLEFEEMFGSSTAQPDVSEARFGPDKLDNTPEEYIINGMRVENYFSPSANVNNRITELINTADHDLSILTMLITRTFIADAITDSKARNVAVNVLTNSEGQNDDVVNESLTLALGPHFTFDNVSQGIMHTKSMIIDQSATDSDPVLLTGSHNWSSSADIRNDENTLVFHDSTLANIYYQLFVERFTTNLGVLQDLNVPPVAVNDTVYIEDANTKTIRVTENDEFISQVKMILLNNGKHGSALVPFTDELSISYDPEDDFTGTDSVSYAIYYLAEPTLKDTAVVYYYVTAPVSVPETVFSDVRLYPNPGNGTINLSLQAEKPGNAEVNIFTPDGKLVYTEAFVLDAGAVEKTIQTGLPAGIYILKVKVPSGSITRKYIVE